MNMQRMADILISAWVLAATTEGVRRARRLPTGQGVLDRALKKVVESGNFTDEFRQLRFVETRIGTRCPELRSLLSWAQAADQTTDPNPSYDTTEAKVSAEVARRVLEELQIDVDTAQAWGEALFLAIEDEKQGGHAAA